MENLWGCYSISNMCSYHIHRGMVHYYFWWQCYWGSAIIYLELFGEQLLAYLTGHGINCLGCFQDESFIVGCFCFCSALSSVTSKG